MSENPDKFSAKKTAVLGNKKKTSNAVLFGLMVVCAVLVVGGGMFFIGQQKDPPPVAALLGPTSAASDVLTYPAAEFDDGKCRFFEHQTPDGLTIRFFVLKSSDGQIRSAFDACDSCWPAGKGYRQDGDDMVCQNCRMRFASVKVMEVKGGCNPSPLPNHLENGTVVIRVEDVEAGKGYFEQGKEG